VVRKFASACLTHGWERNDPASISLFLKSLHESGIVKKTAKAKLGSFNFAYDMKWLPIRPDSLAYRVADLFPVKPPSLTTMVVLPSTLLPLFQQNPMTAWAACIIFLFLSALRRSTAQALQLVDIIPPVMPGDFPLVFASIWKMRPGGKRHRLPPAALAVLSPWTPSFSSSGPLLPISIGQIQKRLKALFPPTPPPPPRHRHRRAAAAADMPAGGKCHTVQPRVVFPSSYTLYFCCLLLTGGSEAPLSVVH
jgi:hypothetical protein